MKWATAFIGLTAVARFAGSSPFLKPDPGVTLAKPRSTPGFMLSLASRALCLRPLRGLRADLLRGLRADLLRGLRAGLLRGLSKHRSNLRAKVR